MIEVLLAVIALLLFLIWRDMPSRKFWESTMISIAKSLSKIADRENKP